MHAHARSSSLGAAIVLTLAAACSSPTASPDASAGDGGPVRDAAPDADLDATRDAGTPSTCEDVVLPHDLASRARWDRDFAIAGLTGLDGVTPIVRDVAPAPDGSAIVVGYFHWAGTQRVEGVARLSGHALAPIDDAGALPLATEGYAAAAVADDGTVYLAPYRMTDTRPGTIVALDTTGPHAIGTFTGNVRSLVVVDGALWALGTLAIDGGGPHGIAIYERGAWHGVSGGDPDGPAYELLVRADGDLVVGGEFTSIGGIAAARVATFDGARWTAMDMPDAGRVVALAEDASLRLWAGGVFSLAPETLASASLARWTGTAWEVADGGVASGDGFGAVSDLVVDGDGVVVVGCFDHVGAGVRAEGVARVEAGAWEALDDGAHPVGSHWFAPFVCGFEPDPAVVWQMPRERASRVGTELVIGGAFGGLGGVASQSVIAHDASAFVALGTSGEGLSGQVLDLDVGGAGCAVHALVGASHVGGVPVAAPVYRLDASGWHAASSPLPSGARCTRLAVGGDGALYLACNDDPSPPDFLLAGYVLRSEGGAWARVGDVVTSYLQDIVRAPDGTPWVVMGAERGAVARVTTSGLETVDGDFDGAAIQLAFGPARADGSFDAVVGGVFMHVGAMAATRIARWDASAWSTLGSGLGSAPSALAVGASAIYAATQDEGNPDRLTLGRFDGSTWTELATPAHGLATPALMTTHTFTSLALRGDVLVATGYVWPEGQGRNAFVFADDQFAALAGGASAISVDAVAITSSAIVLAGSIAEVGIGASTLPSIGVARARF